MDEIDFISLLGRASDSPEVQAVLARFEMKPPKLKKGDVRTTADAKGAGLFLSFADQAFLTKDKNLAIGEGALILTGVSFMDSSSPDWSTYAGRLPFQVSLGDSQQAVRARLGEPEKTNQALSQERWLKDGKWLFAKYQSGFSRLTKFTVQVPD